MQEPSFDQLVAEAATGLKGDRELYLDVTTELRSQLEEKAEKYASQGYSDEESAELAKKSFGSPLDVAGELLSANKRRMRLRALARLTIGALLVPLAILLALYAGYGRFARLQQLAGGFMVRENPIKLPTLPFFHLDTEPAHDTTDIINQLNGNFGNAENIRRYWEEHRQDADSHIYYAYYALFVENGDERQYADAMRLGEKMEPQNALYNVLLSEYYLRRGISAQLDKSGERGQPRTDDLLDRRTFELGMAELRKAVQKPYLRTYQMQVTRKRLNAMPRPLLTEDYVPRMAIASGVLFPTYARYRVLAKKIPACARLLIGEGRNAEAEVVMDSWRPLTRLLASDSGEQYMIKALACRAMGELLTQQAGGVYDRLGAHAKAEDARSTAELLKQLHAEWRSGGQEKAASSDDIIRTHGPRFAGILLPAFGGGRFSPTEDELTPGRMHEHVLFEEAGIQVLLCLLTLLLLGTLLQSAICLCMLRRASAVPLLLLPPAREIARALLVGVLLPLLLYWLYSRLPVVGGREYGWASGMWPRFAAELALVGLLILWLPARHIRRYLRRRCDDLKIALPTQRDEAASGRKVSLAVALGLFCTAIFAFIPSSDSVVSKFEALLLGDAFEWLRFGVLVVVAGITILLLRVAVKSRAEFGLYYGTLARSMMPVYAFTILAVALIAQPWQLCQEAHWLRKDTLIFANMADTQSDTVGFTIMETRAAQEYTRLLLKALERE